jgi:hypothetical protein
LKATNSILNLLRGRSGLLSWTSIHCVFCGKRTVCHAVFATGLACCKACDEKNWPEKVPQFLAWHFYWLDESDLFQRAVPNTSGGRTAAPGLAFGTFLSGREIETVFPKHQLEALAERVYGTGWRAKRQEIVNREKLSWEQKQHIKVEMESKLEILSAFKREAMSWSGLDLDDKEELLSDAPHGW